MKEKKNSKKRFVVFSILIKINLNSFAKLKKNIYIIGDTNLKKEKEKKKTDNKYLIFETLLSFFLFVGF